MMKGVWESGLPASVPTFDIRGTLSYFTWQMCNPHHHHRRKITDSIIMGTIMRVNLMYVSLKVFHIFLSQIEREENVGDETDEEEEKYI